MTLTAIERNQLSRRILVFYHRVLVDMRNWIYDGEIEKAQDAADYFEPIVIDYINIWSIGVDDSVYSTISQRIALFIKKYNDRFYYHEIFDLEYSAFVKKYAPIAKSNIYKLHDF